jgi:hypothetical protein
MCFQLAVLSTADGFIELVYLPNCKMRNICMPQKVKQGVKQTLANQCLSSIIHKSQKMEMTQLSINK